MDVVERFAVDRVSPESTCPLARWASRNRARCEVHAGAQSESRSGRARCGRARAHRLCYDTGLTDCRVLVCQQVSSAVSRCGGAGADFTCTRAREYSGGQAAKQQSSVDRLRKVPAEALRSEEHTSELQSPCNLVCRLL